MRSLVAFCASLIIVKAEPAPLTEADRIALQEQLEKIQKQSDERVGGLYRRALQDYRSAIRSDDAAMDLYLKCLEKVQFTDEKKKAIEFREWKRKNKDRLKSGSMRMALRQQLSWLLLSIEAAHRDEDLGELSSRAMKHLDQIFEHAETLKDHRSILDQDALGSVFAKAYKLNIKVEKWPKSALDISGIYEHVVMPQLRKPGRIEALRKAWNKRIEHEGLKIEKWTRDDSKRIGTKKSMRSSQFEKFLSEKRPTMLWKKEMDCYEVGDQRVAAVNMLKHVETYITHKDAPEWIEEFKGLIQPEKQEGKSSSTSSQD
ncbi:MAG: hypothetical protein AB8F34_00290 [Akkermansiaceae bacterium]